MALLYPPLPGTILRCDFHTFKEPEMTKARPVIVLSPKVKNHIRTTLLIVALSTKEPSTRHNYHMKVTLPGTELPEGLSRECWLKGDMVYSLCTSRLNFYRMGRDKHTGKRAYYTDRFTGESLFNIRKAIMHAVGLH